MTVSRPQGERKDTPELASALAKYGGAACGAYAGYAAYGRGLTVRSGRVRVPVPAGAPAAAAAAPAESSDPRAVFRANAIAPRYAR
jgi:hypothetical protein